ncbi:hypothetical protein RABR111495_06965 [Rahnella bruchi]
MIFRINARIACFVTSVIKLSYNVHFTVTKLSYFPPVPNTLINVDISREV